MQDKISNDRLKVLELMRFNADEMEREMGMMAEELLRHRVVAKHINKAANILGTTLHKMTHGGMTLAEIHAATQGAMQELNARMEEGQPKVEVVVPEFTFSSTKAAEMAQELTDLKSRLLRAGENIEVFFNLLEGSPWTSPVAAEPKRLVRGFLVRLARDLGVKNLHKKDLSERDRRKDLFQLSQTVVEDRLDNQGPLNSYVMEGGDPLIYYVTRALGVDANDYEEVAWGTYCIELFNDVKEHIISALRLSRSTREG